MKNTKQRLASLDILRGLDLFLLVCIQPILMEIGKVTDNATFHSILYQFDHEVWEGFRLWDLIMPLFLFMSGISIPFSLDGKKDLPKAPTYLHLFRRFLILWLLGMIMQGNLLSLDGQQFKYYSNTLQAIAMGYLWTSILYLQLDIRKIIVLAVSLLLLYAVPFYLDGDYSRMGNFALQLDQTLMGRTMDGAYWDGKQTIFSEQYDYSWIWSSLTFTVTVIMGCLAGKIMKIGAALYPKRVFYQLLGIGLLCIVLGLLWRIEQPIIKRIWTSSMTLFSGGICFVLMALFYYSIDLKKIVRPFEWLKIYGMNSIVAYFIGELVNFRSVVHSLTYGIENMLPDYQALILTIGNFGIVFLILLALYKCRVFVKI